MIINKRILALLPLLLVAYETVVYFSNDMYLPAMPQMIIDLDTSAQMIQMTLAIWFMGSASLQMFLGPLSDRYGRRPIILWGAVLFLIPSVVCAITSHITLMLIARFLQGASVCFVLIASYSCVNEIYDHKKAIQILTWMSAVTILAPALGPIGGVLVLHIGDWRLIFWLLALGGAVGMFALYKWMPESNPNGKEEHPIIVSKIFSNYKAILTNRNFLSYTLILCLIYAGLMAWITVGPLLVMQDFGHSDFIYGFIQAAIFAMFIVCSQLINIILKHTSLRGVIRIGLLMSVSGGIVAIFSAIILPNHIAPFVIAMMLYAGGTGFLYAPLQRLAIAACKEPMGSRTAMFTTALGIFSVVGSVFVTLVYNGQLISLALLMGILVILAGLLKYFMPPLITE